MTETTKYEPPIPGRSRPGGRSARVRAAVLAAARELVADQGYEPVGIEQIAARAGVHKTTVYRRWPTKARLVMDAVEDMSAERVPVPDTGTLASDLREFSRSIVANLNTAGAATLARALVAAAADSDELRAAAAEFWHRRFGVAGEMVARAVERQEIPADTDSDALIETLIGPLYVRVLLTDVAVDRGLADRVAAITAEAARAGSFSR
jgi:AcrR family transcriptional regulator